MDRSWVTPRYIPTCPSQIAVVDQYMWPTKDTANHICNNGISHPIYNCKGDIHFSLPLEMYPKVGKLHPQIQPVYKNLHTNMRKNITIPNYPGTRINPRSGLQFTGAVSKWDRPPYPSNYPNFGSKYQPDNFWEDPKWTKNYQRGEVPNYPIRENCCGKLF
jgi:hypothetical protein